MATPIRRLVRRHSQHGAALLIAICALLLISVVAIALVVSQGTDSALAGNYRTSTGAYYAALAGLEEARGRLLWKNPDVLTNAFVPIVGNSPALPPNNVRYILNDPSALSTYPDTEYGNEFPGGLAGATVATTSSSPALAGLPLLQGPMYKWVRINPVTEAALKLDVDGDNDASSTAPLYYNGTGLTTSTSGTVQALALTALAVLPSGSKTLLQYVVAPTPLSLYLNFPSALTLAGNNVTYSGPSSRSFFANGNDPTAGRSCNTPAKPPVPAIGFTNGGDASQANILTGTSAQPSNYQGVIPPPPAPANPSIGQVSLPPNLMMPSKLDALVQSITQGADLILPSPTNQGRVTASRFPTSTSASNPMTIVVNGDLDLTGWRNTGYGLLVVTGALNFDQDSTWEGIVLVIGKGVFTESGSASGSGRIDGALLVAQTRDAYGNLLPDPNLGAASATFSPNSGGAGLYFNSCWISNAEMPASYRVLSFREIPFK